jgi:glycosyltransferase involved in cell wall biosynthesis
LSQGSEPLRVALLAPLDEAVRPQATTAEAIVTFELAETLATRAGAGDSIAFDLFARRGSWRGMPLVSIDPGEIGDGPRGALSGFARQEAAYVQLWLAGLLDGYAVVHALAPVVAPLQLAAAAGSRVVQTLLVPPSHPAAWMPESLLPRDRLRRVRIGVGDDATTAPPTLAGSVDLERFTPPPAESRHVLWSGSGSRAAGAARAVAAGLGLPARTVARGDAARLVREAAVVLDLSEQPPPAGSPWALRALACGVPAAGWHGGGLDALAADPAVAVTAQPGRTDELAAAIAALPRDASAAERRRDVVLARNGRTAMAARYRELYRSVLQPPRSGYAP